VPGTRRFRAPRICRRTCCPGSLVRLAVDPFEPRPRCFPFPNYATIHSSRDTPSMNRETLQHCRAGESHSSRFGLRLRGWVSRSKLLEGTSIRTFQIDARSYMSLKTRFSRRCFYSIVRDQRVFRPSTKDRISCETSALSSSFDGSHRVWSVRESNP
jgi:hypothetical protein